MAIATGTGLALAGAATIGGAALGAKAAKKGARAQAAAAEAGTAAQLQMFREQQRAMEPWRQYGGGALQKYAGFLGVQPMGQPAQQVSPYMAYPSMRGEDIGRGGLLGGTSLSRTGFLPSRRIAGARTTQPIQTVAQPMAQQPEMSFAEQLKSIYPSYGFQMEEGLGAIERSAAARGLLQSGGTMQGLLRYSQGLAGSAAENYLNRLQGMAGLGQTAATNIGQMGMQTAANQAALAQQAGQARASGYLGQAQAWGGGLTGLATLLGSSGE